MSETDKNDAAAAMGDLAAGEAGAPGGAASGPDGDFDDGAPPSAKGKEAGPRLNEAFSRFDAALREAFGEPRPRAVIVRARTIWAVFAAGAALGACAAGLAAAAGFILAIKG
jgi:hypothetical protein